MFSVKKKWIVVGAFSFLGALPALAQLTATQLEDLGYTDLQALLGVGTPTGAGLSWTMVEASSGGNYIPNMSHVELAGKGFVNETGTSSTASGHATTVARHGFGSSSLAPGVGNTADGQDIGSWEVNDWMSTFLRTGTSSALPEVETRDLQNHSWIGSTGDTSTDSEILRRADYTITRDDYLAAYGLNNGSGTSVPNLMASAYNGISVGLSNGGHSTGSTSLDGSGREKPDLVVSESFTSYATPVVLGAGALLLETAANDGTLSNAQRHEVVKALLMNGATKDESEFSGGWSNSSTVPLDTTYGAGELNVFNSYNNLVSGEQAASDVSAVEEEGWDLGTVDSAAVENYFFTLEAGSEYDLTATMAWDRIVEAVDSNPMPGITDYDFTSTLANLDLRLYDATGLLKGALLAESISSVDNVELIFLQDLAAGDYVLEVSSASVDSTDYGLAWRIDAVPEPSSLLLALGGLSLFFSRRR